MNIGYSSRLPYDACAYDDKVAESVGSLLYKLNSNQIANCNACLSTLGPRGRYGVSTLIDSSPTNTVAPSQQLVDVESILSNRNVPTSKCKTGNVNSVNLNDFGLINPNTCNKYLDPVSSRLTYPSRNYRSMALNRFHDLPKNPQEPIFWDFATNTKLEAKDNFKAEVANVKQYDAALLDEIGITKTLCKNKCNALCPRNCTYKHCEN